MNRPERKKLSPWIKIPLYLLALFIGSVFTLYTFRAEIFNYAEKRLGVKVSLRDIRIFSGQSPGIELDGLGIASKTHLIRSFQIDSLRVLFAQGLWETGSGDFRIEDIIIKNPRLVLVRPEKKKEKKHAPDITSKGGETSRPWEVRNFSVENGQLTINSPEGKKQIDGKYNISGHLINSKNPSPAGLNGQITFSIKKVYVRQFEVLGKIFQLINPQTYIKGEGTDMRADGLVFNSISGALTIKNGVGTLEKTHFKSAAWNILTTGELDFVKDEMDLDVYIQPLQTVDKVASWIPIIGEILKEKDRGVFDIYIKVKGKMDDPKVESKQASNLADKIFGIIKRAVPGRGAPAGK